MILKSHSAIKHITKIRTSLRKVDADCLFSIPHKIAFKLILAAKSGDAKIRLVRAATLAKDESYRRMIDNNRKT